VFKGIFFVNTPEKGTEPNAVQKAKGSALFQFMPQAGLQLHTIYKDGQYKYIRTVRHPQRGTDSPRRPDRMERLGRIPDRLYLGNTLTKSWFCNLLTPALHSAFCLSDKFSLEKTVFGRADLNKSEEL
jgi:hypothetical protein